jgi:hypothetical protein
LKRWWASPAGSSSIPPGPGTESTKIRVMGVLVTKTPT